MSNKRRKISTVVYLRYLLMNLPGLAGLALVLIIVGHWFVLPGWLFILVFAGWVIKEIVLFPLVWRSYDPDGSSVTGTMVGKSGIVQTRLDPTGYVLVRGELWRAERADAGPPVEKGCLVRVQRMDGLTLYVTPE